MIRSAMTYQNPESDKLVKQNLTQNRKGALVRLLKYSFKHKLLVSIANISLVITSLGVVALPYLAGQIVDLIAKQDPESKTELNNIVGEFTLVFIVVAIFSFVRAALFELLGEKVILELRNELFGQLILKDIEFFDHNRSGELISRITSDITLIQAACSETISILLRNLVQFIGSIVLLLIISWKLTLVFLCVTPIFFLIATVFVHFYKKLAKQYQDELALSTQVATETLQNIRVVKSFSTEENEKKQFYGSTYKAYLVGRKKSILAGAFAGAGMLLGNLSMICVLWYGGVLVLEGEMTIGDLSSFVLYTMTLAVSVIAMTGMINILLTASAVSEKVFELMDHETKIKNGTYKSSQFDGSIQLKDVHFCYPTKDTVPVLQNFSIEILSGEVVAFVGVSGSGKSTIVGLLERFYDASQGEILVDGINIKEWDITYLHQQIGFVSQEPTLFSGTLRQNVVYGAPNATTEQIQLALKQAHAFDFVMNKDYFPDGLETVVGERGVKLSGGQKQRIAIARALIKNPKILIFDEATSALDAESEYQVQLAIDELMLQGQKTMIIIAHRLSTIINCKKIGVVEKGRIIEFGPHQELVKQNGAYKSLIERQLAGLSN